MANASDILRKARALITQPEAWTRHTMARDGDGDDVSVFNTHAVSYCTEGAIFKCGGVSDKRWLAFETLISTIRQDSDYVVFLTTWNDDPAQTHSNVLATFDQAIEAAEQQERSLVAE